MAKDNTIYIRKNKERQTDKHPEYRGSGVVAGTEYWVSAWVNTDDQTGEKYFSCSLQPKQARPKVAPKSREPGEDDSPFDDSDLPF